TPARPRSQTRDSSSSRADSETTDGATADTSAGTRARPQPFPSTSRAREPPGAAPARGARTTASAPRSADAPEAVRASVPRTPSGAADPRPGRSGRDNTGLPG